MIKRAGDPLVNTTPSKIATWEPSDNTRTPEKKKMPSFNNVSPVKMVRHRSSSEVVLEEIQTYVFFDLETTGILQDEPQYKFDRNLDTQLTIHTALKNYCLTTRLDACPYITEMSFVAIPREAFKEQQKKYHDDSKNNRLNHNEYIPTCTHTRQIRPCMTEMEWADYETRFKAKRSVFAYSKDQIIPKNDFKTEWPCVVDFLKNLPKPAVLIAHNGLKFDMRIIHAEMKRHGLLESHPIPESVFFADTLLMSRKLEEQFVDSYQLVTKMINFGSVFDAKATKIEVEQEEYPDTFETHAVEENPLMVQAGIKPNGEKADDHPVKHFNMYEFSIAMEKRMKEDLFTRLGNRWTYDKKTHMQKTRHSLPIIFEDLFKGNYCAHYAQPDAEALMKVCLAYKDDFIEYVDKMSAAIPF